MLGIVLTAVALGIPTFCLILWIKNARFRNAINKIPGPAGVPIIGNVLQCGNEGAEFLRVAVKWSEEYKEGLHRIWMGSRGIINVYKAELLEPIMNSSKNTKKSKMYLILEPWLQDGLLMSFGQKWLTRRKMLTPTFHYTILEDFMLVFEKQTEKLIELLKTKADGSEFDIYPYIANCALDIICMTAMGIDLDAQHVKSNYTEAVYRISTLMLNRFVMPWYYNDHIFALSPMGREHNRTIQLLHKFTKSVILQRMEEYKQKMKDGKLDEKPAEEESFKKKRLAFLDLLVKQSLQEHNLTVNDIQEEVDTFMFEGHDTTTSAMGWALYNFGRHPEWQERVREEIESTIGLEGPIEMGDMNKLKIFESFLKESIRMFTTVPFVSREVTDECEMAGYQIPKGAIVQILFTVLHRDPRYFPEPDKFDPERWMNEDAGFKRHPFAFLPFSAGPRNCIGQRFANLEEKYILISILRNFRITCDHNIDDIKHQDGELVLRPSKGLFVKLRGL